VSRFYATVEAREGRRLVGAAYEDVWRRVTLAEYGSAEEAEREARAACERAPRDCRAPGVRTEERWPDLSRTEAALAVYAKGETARTLAWGACSTDADVEACQAADRRALEAVQDAFALDTADRNHPSQCRLLGLSTLREWVARWRCEACGCECCRRVEAGPYLGDVACAWALRLWSLLR